MTSGMDPGSQVAIDLGVVVLAPTGRDASLICQALADAGLPCQPVHDSHALAEEITRGAGIAVVAEEALTQAGITHLLHVLADQPSWSDFPFIVLTAGRNHVDRSTTITTMQQSLGNVTLLERPVRMNTLISAVRSGLRARQRQYQVRNHERALFESESRYRSLVMASSNLVWLTDPDGRITAELPQWSEVTGQSFAEYRDWGWTEAIHPEDREKVMLGFCEALRTNQPFLAECRLLCQGVYRRVLARAVPVRDETGQPREWVGACTDIEQQRAAEEALIRQEKLALAGRLAAAIAHEINNPLQAVTNLVSLISTGADLEQARQFASLAQAELSRVSHIVTQTLAFYRQPAETKANDLAEIIDSVLALMQPKIAKANIEVIRELDLSQPLVCAAGEIRQILANIIANAVEAMPTGGKLRIRLRAVSDWRGHTGQGIRVTIADTGPGIPAEIRERIFEPFFTTKDTVGTGLGLWVTAQLMQKCAGRIAVFSSTRPPRSGTVFSLFFPHRSQ
jgi:PAS domain S-box-containing protein